MNEIEIFLYFNRGLVGHLIGWQTRSAYSHAAIRVKGILYQSKEGKGVFSRKELDVEDSLAEIYKIEVTPKQLVVLEEFLQQQVGKKYDYTMVFRFLTRQQESRKTSNKWFCSELVFASCMKAGVILLRNTESWEVSPSLLSRSVLLKD